MPNALAAHAAITVAQSVTADSKRVDLMVGTYTKGSTKVSRRPRKLRAAAALCTRITDHATIPNEVEGEHDRLDRERPPLEAPVSYRRRDARLHFVVTNAR